MLNALATNAPAEWPDVTADAIGENWAVSVARIGAALKRGFERSARFRLAAFLRTRVLDDGILEIPIVVADGTVEVPVFVYLHGTAEDAGHFTAVGRLLAGKGLSAPVYFAPRPLPVGGDGINPLKPLAPDCLERARTVQAGEYAMWWATSDARPFGESSAFRCIDRAYEALDGYTTYAAGLFLKPLGLVQGDAARIQLPERAVNVPVVGPEEVQLVLSVERERGVQLLFHTSSTPTPTRDRLWELFARYAEGLRQHAISRGWPVDDAMNRQSAAWWPLARAGNTSPERSRDPVRAVGVLSL